MRFEHVLLGFVAMRPCTGYDLKRWLDSEMGRMIRLRTQQSQIYRTLRRMSEDGWLSCAVERNEGRPDAKVYRVTEAGEAVLMARLAEPYSPPPDFGEPEFLIRYTFAIFLPRAEQIALVRTELEARRAQVERFRARDIRPEPWLPRVDPARMGRILDHVHQYKERALATHVRWLEEVLAELTA
ncbi:PadR family transcriptional regulator [Streptomyces sp. DSM 44917]|uniref:PadR family transcriptional regulator n=1 Tax=Streptomyces boetiae TaxID=3075541 RepID=A0ABU2L9Q6_9ACTN|nr:PadR family transcriptional regulator [Streptomyces sp. DSM 44917]MDT0308289.1 PadR family transcriptional regulator [Streptomyces sp. DSM 44917]